MASMILCVVTCIAIVTQIPTHSPRGDGWAWSTAWLRSPLPSCVYVSKYMAGHAKGDTRV
jgi:hypothetical protein